MKTISDKISGFLNYFVFDGVSIFFVLSGYLIGGILLRQCITKGLSLKVIRQFWVRRWFRTLPNYFLILTVLCILNNFLGNNFVFGDVSSYFFFSQNLFNVHPNFFPEAWSLSIEEWFYILLPIFVFLFSLFFKSYQKGVIILALLLIVAALVYRYYVFIINPPNGVQMFDSYFRKRVFTRLDSLMYGVVGAYCVTFYEKIYIRYKNILFLFGLILFIASHFFLSKLLLVTSVYYCVLSFSLTSIATLALLPLLSSIKAGKGFIYRLLTFMSIISYSMYLVNLSLIQDWILSWINFDIWVHNSYWVVTLRYLSYWFLVFLISAFLYKYFESPMTSLREKFK